MLDRRILHLMIPRMICGSAAVITATAILGFLAFDAPGLGALLGLASSAISTGVCLGLAMLEPAPPGQWPDDPVPLTAAHEEPRS